MLSGTTTLLSEQKITSPLGTRKRNTTATLRQRLPWQTLDHKPLLSEKENNCHTHTKNLTQSKAEKSDYLWIAFSLCCSLPTLHPPTSTPNTFILGQFTCQEVREVLGRKKVFLKYLLSFNNIQKCNSFPCVSVNLRLWYSILKPDQSYLHKEISGLRNADSILLLWKAYICMFCKLKTH